MTILHSNTTPNPGGNPPNDPKGRLNLGLIFRLGIITGVFLAGLGVGLIGSAPNSNAPSNQPSAVTQPLLSAADYERMQLGMTLVEVRALLGPGLESERTPTSATLIWQYSDGSSITGVFENDSLVGKRRSPASSSSG